MAIVEPARENMQKIGVWAAGLLMVLGLYIYSQYELRREYSWSGVSKNAGFAEDTGHRTILFTGLGPDDSLGRVDVGNPERGFRTEIILDAADLSPAFNDDGKTRYSPDFAQALLQNTQAYHYPTDVIKLTQLYFYLDSTLVGKPIPAPHLQNIASALAGLEKAGYKAIIRFAYQKQAKPTADCSPRNSTSHLAPKVQVRHIQAHLEQLAPLLQEHYPVIHAVQAGFVGAWGEWHNDFYGHPCHSDSVEAILQTLLKVVPEQRTIMVREPSLKRKGGLDGNLRVGYHNDYFVLDQGKHKSSDYSKAKRGLSRNNRRHFERQDFVQVLREGYKTSVDGEMPYDTPGDEWALNQILPHSDEFAQRMRLHGYTSFSIVHNYGTNVQGWKNKTITASQLRKDKAPVTDGYFLNKDGKEVPRVLYEYLRDHLGYRLQLVKATIPRTLQPNAANHISVSLKNFGFAAPINPRQAYLVLIDPQDRVLEFPTDANLHTWYPFQMKGKNVYSMSADVSVDESFKPGVYKIGIWLPDKSEQLKYKAQYAIKLPNRGVQRWTDPDKKYLVNVLAEVPLYASGD